GELRAPAQPPGPGQVNNQVQVAAGEVEELAAPADVADDQPRQLAQGRVERLQHRERCRFGAGDDVPAGTLAQEGGQRLHFWQFGHVTEFTDQVTRSTRSGNA